MPSSRLCGVEPADRVCGATGIRCDLVAHKVKGCGVAIMTNGDNGGIVIRELKDRIARVYDWGRSRERGYLYRSMIDSGAVVMNGTDPPVEEIDPIASFHCSVTRELPDGTIFLPEQAMTREQALRSYTLNNAFAAFENGVKGSLAPGKYADITVFSKDLLTIPEEEIRSAEVVYTIIGGQVRFERPKS